MKIRASRYERVTGAERRDRIGVQRKKHVGVDLLSRTLKNEIGERIRIGREALGLSQAEFGAGTGGFSYKKVSKYERGEHWPPFTWLVAMSERFGITPNYVILGWDEELRPSLRKAIKALRNRNTA